VLPSSAAEPAGVGAPVPADVSQVGIRFGHIGTGYEVSASVFDGFNHLPIFVPTAGPPAMLRGEYPAIRTYGVDGAVPTRWFTVKGEAAYVTSSTSGADEYILYVLQLERQAGEWSIVGGYAGERVTHRRAAFDFAPDRGLTGSLVARAAYTIDSNRSVALEGVARQNGGGVYARAEYSQAVGGRWRTTATAAVIGGDPDDFLGQYRRNSHAGIAIRYSF
jgi:hypothetical protein